MFRKINLDLGNGYSIATVKESSDIAITVTHDSTAVGSARLTTDDVDVSCITAVSIDDNHVGYKFNYQHTLGELLIKFLIKFPTVVRKPEFRFILDATGNLKSAIEKYHFDRGEGTNLENEILIRKSPILPEYRLSEKVIFKRDINAEKLLDLLAFLKRNAYWQKNLTLDRLILLVQNSQCFFALSETNEIIGFARIVTNNTSFASLWDVAIDERYRKNGIATALMTQIFSDATLSKIPSWILFTDTAKKLYEKFGFVSATEIPDRRLVHKLRLQESCPDYMPALTIKTLSGLPVHLNREQSFEFLYGEAGKRARLSLFWKDMVSEQKLQTQSPVKSGSMMSLR